MATHRALRRDRAGSARPYVHLQGAVCRHLSLPYRVVNSVKQDSIYNVNHGFA